MGALRLASDAGGEEGFLAQEPFPVPSLAKLREVEHWARQVEEGVGAELSNEERWLAMLVAPGSSLGGSRPKANYEDQGELWIAKFPSREDRHDVGAREHLRQLFRRIVFNLLTANRDDHLRNHGFLRSRGGWRLAPAFDMNPTPQKHEHVLALDDSVRTPDLEVVRETAPFYRLSAADADELVDEIRSVVAGWRDLAQRIGLAADELERIGSALTPA